MWFSERRNAVAGSSRVEHWKSTLYAFLSMRAHCSHKSIVINTTCLAISGEIPQN